MRLPRFIWFIGALITISALTLVGLFIKEEMRTSRLQAEILTPFAAKMTYSIQPGPSPLTKYPEDGPYDRRLGYAYIPYFIKALTSSNYEIAWQARPSQELVDFMAGGGSPIYREKTSGGLRIYDRTGTLLHEGKYPTHTFSDFASVPPLLVNTLLFIENRELLQSGSVTRNPAIEWDRFLLAAVGQGLGTMVPAFSVGGGSTLATQIEKFRHSPGGQTSGPIDKLWQVASATMRVYMDGPDTTATRQRIALDYLNATPLAARSGWGEVNGIGDGLWIWFGIDLDQASDALRAPENDRAELRRKADAYKHALALVLAQRRPSYYLIGNRAALRELADITLDKLAAHDVISPALRDAAKPLPLRFLAQPPEPPSNSFVEQKAVNAVRNNLLSLLGLQSMYELDRLDMSVGTTLDLPVQQRVTEFLKNLRTPEFIKEAGLEGSRLLSPQADLSRVNWTVLLFERGANGNVVRIQADNLDQPLDLNDGAKLDLGSTAKLRTLITYLEIITILHSRYADMDNNALDELAAEAPDNLTQWATGWLRDNRDRRLSTMLAAAMERTYSASPREAFFTGGGRHTFNNFERADDGRVVTISESFRKSINLPFIRLMRDIVNFVIAQGPLTKQEILGDPDHPARKAYLERFADREGRIFLNRYYADYAKLDPDQTLNRLIARSRKSSTAKTVVFRSVRPQASFEDYAAFMRRIQPHSPLTNDALLKLYTSYPIDRYSLADRGYIAGVNPLELWLVGYMQHPGSAGRTAMLNASLQERIDTYSWLFRTRAKAAQDSRIRTLLEQDAFAAIRQSWARLGYPFERLVPSLATAIGSSADRPGALAELMGIILNDGAKLPTMRIDQVNIAPETPYQTALVRSHVAENRLLPKELAETLRKALVDVVANGTAHRVEGAFSDANGQALIIGGKTGTGDHRFNEYAPGGRLISSRVVKRTATFVFFIGDRFFGTITAHVDGPEAAHYSFTSALPAQMLRALAPTLQPLFDKPPMTDDTPDETRVSTLR